MMSWVSLGQPGQSEWLLPSSCRTEHSLESINEHQDCYLWLAPFKITAAPIFVKVKMTGSSAYYEDDDVIWEHLCCKPCAQGPTSVIFVKKMAQRCGVWQIKRMTSLDQDQVSMKSNMFGFRGYSQMKFYKTYKTAKNGLVWFGMVRACISC